MSVKRGALVTDSVKKNRGIVMIVGGAEEKNPDAPVLKKFIDLSGGDEAVISIVPTASMEPDEVMETYRDVFDRSNVKKVNFIDIRNRKDASLPKNIKMLRESSGVFFTGGDQLRITTILGGTEFRQALAEIYALGCVIAGTSAGAAMMASTMIKGGMGDVGLLRGGLHLGPGLNIVPGVIIDTHFVIRSRIGRLIHAISENPSYIGIGLAQDTGLIIPHTGICEVVGSNVVTIVDGNQIEYTNITDIFEGEAISVSPITLHVLVHGDRFDLYNAKRINTRRSIAKHS